MHCIVLDNQVQHRMTTSIALCTATDEQNGCMSLTMDVLYFMHVLGVLRRPIAIHLRSNPCGLLY